jgi:uncharacterized membrane-anchored protein
MTIHPRFRYLVRHVLVAFTFGAVALAASAQAADDAAAHRAFDDARQAATSGPHDVPLAGQAVLKLPAGHAFVPLPQAGAMLNAMGNPGHDEQLQGLIVPKGDNDSWFIIVRYVDEGYIQDDDAKDWNADEPLQSASTDQVAAYGLAALVGGVAAKKLGYLALALAFLAKFAKVAILAVAGLGAVTSRWFKRGRDTTA